MKTLSFTFVWLLMACHVILAQGPCAKVSTEVTFRFAIETPVNPVDSNGPMIVDHYHADLELSFRPGGWQVVASYDCPGCGATGLDLLPEEALLVGNLNSRWILSSIPPAFEFIGAKPGEPFWVLPQNAGTGALPLGIGAEQTDNARLCPWNPGDTRGAHHEDKWLQMQLLDLRGPADANFAMWQADGLRPPVVFISTHEGGITADDAFYISNGSHVHMNWGFTQSGLYEIDFRIATVLHCEEWLTADWAPLGDAYYNGDCKVDFLDFARLAAHWLQIPMEDDPNIGIFVDPDNPADSVNSNNLKRLADQWLLCAYAGCSISEANGEDPPELNDN
jgi:surface-anchored protein